MTTKTVTTFIAFLIISASTAAFGQDEARPVTIDDLMALKSVGDPQVSPDGQWVAYVVRERDMDEDKSFSRIWMVPAAGGEAIPMTAKETSAGNPRWSPDNKYLSFKASKGEEGKAKAQVWNLNRMGGEAIEVTNVKQGIDSFEWSPDGSRLLLVIQDPKPADLTEDEKDDKRPTPAVIDRMQFKMDYTGYLDRRRTHIYTYAPGDDAPVQVTFGDYDDENPVWKPDGTAIAFVSDRSDNPDLNYGNDVFVVDLSGEEPALRQVTSNPGRDFDPAWSPDGATIAYVTSTGPDIGGSALSPTHYLAVTAANAAERRILTPELDRNVSNPHFSADGRDIYFELQDSGQDHLAAIRANGRNFRRLIDGAVAVRDYSLRGGRMVALVSNPGQPHEIYAVNDGGLARLTHVNDATLDGVARADVEAVHFDSADGTPIEAYLTRPVGYQEGQRYPMILWLHGGPASQFSADYSEIAQLFAANGYAVLMPNPRGSTGYGEAFAKGTVAAWGVKDFQDVMAGVDYAIDAGIADADKLGVGGWSYGGILTNFTITQTDRFAAASSGASLGLTTAMYGHDQYQLMYELEFGLPWEDPDLWVKLSPFYRVENITTPTLWMGGAVDWNVPIINSEQMYIGMKRLGRETQLVVYPGEHHGIRRPSFQKDRLERWLDWYGKYLKQVDVASAM